MTDRGILPRHPWLLLAALSFGAAMAFQGSRGLWEPDEGRYAECAREMAVTGDWVTPRLSGSVHFTKPPLTYWAIILGLEVLGANEWGVRLHLAVAFSLTVLLVGALGSRMWDRPTGFLAGLIYATMVFPLTAANVVTTDTLLTLWETLAVLCFWFAFSSAGTSAGWWAAGMWAAAGAAFLTKGPPALFPAISMLVFLVLERRAGRRVRWPINVPGLLLFTGIGLVWYFLVIGRHEGLLGYLLKSEIAGRAGGIHERNPHWYEAVTVYVPTIVVGSLPWGVAVPVVYGRWRKGDGWWEQLGRLRASPPVLFLALWFLLPLAVFCVVRSRLPLYVLPLFAPIALAAARGLVRYAPIALPLSLGFPNRFTLAVGAWLLAVLSLKLAAASVRHPQDDRALWDRVQRTLGDERILVIGADVRRHGLTFYSRGSVEMLEQWRTLPPPLDQQEKVVGDRVQELARVRAAYAILTRSRHTPVVGKRYRNRGYAARVVRVDDEYTLVVFTRDQRGTR